MLFLKNKPGLIQIMSRGILKNKENDCKNRARFFVYNTNSFLMEKESHVQKK